MRTALGRNLFFHKKQFDMDKLWVVDESVGVGGPRVGKKCMQTQYEKRRDVKSAKEAEGERPLSYLIRARPRGSVTRVSASVL